MERGKGKGWERGQRRRKDIDEGVGEKRERVVLTTMA